MSAIDTQNAKQIRDPMLISCGIAARSDISLSISNVSGFVVADTNPATSLASEEWPILRLTDLQDTGFPLDGSCVFYDPGAGSEDGKAGLKTHIGGTGSLTVSSSSVIPALTVYTEGEGTITANGTEYEARGVNVIPVNATSISLVFESSRANQRMEIYSIIPGVNISWDQDTLVSVTLDLRSDLAIENATWQVSEIEIQGYYPDDISEAVSGINDNVPIWYTAGYSGDMSPERRFYLSEPVTMENNIITIKGHDASYKLGEKSKAAQILNTTSGNGKRNLYVQMMHFIQDAGITLRSKESAPATTSGTVQRSLIFKAGTPATYVADIMNLAHTGTYWPTFVDAGIPKLTHTKPTSKWTISESDCGDVARYVDRNVAVIKSGDDYGLHSMVTRANNWHDIATRHVEKDDRYSQNFGEYCWSANVTNAVDISATAESIWWTAKESTISVPVTRFIIDDKGNVTQTTEIKYINECVVKAKSASMKKVTDTVTANPKRAGITVQMSPIAYGRVFAESVHLYPNYNYLFNRSNITGSFTWKGDPRMQPRDVFTFVRLDGTSETCTIENITLKHEGGGTIAEIRYRLGVC